MIEISYRLIFQDDNKVTEQAELVISVGSWARDSREFILLSMMMFYNPSNLFLTNRRKIESLQVNYTTLLQRYLQHK